LARIELRDATIRIRDGLSGTAAINDASIMAGDSGLTVNTVVLNTADTDQIPIGARFTIAGETGLPIHTVLTRVGNPTTSITFSPVLAAGVVDLAVITFLPQQIEIKIGDGNLTYTEAKEYEYLLDRGNLDTVREGDEQPLEVNLEFVYEFVRTGTNELITPVDALKGIGGAVEWVSSSDDPCEPYCVDLIIEHAPPCGTAQDETTVFPEFRRDSLEFDLSAATIAVTGRSNVSEATITRS
jgi:hypothetical protein